MRNKILFFSIVFVMGSLLFTSCYNYDNVNISSDKSESSTLESTDYTTSTTEIVTSTEKETQTTQKTTEKVEKLHSENTTVHTITTVDVNTTVSDISRTTNNSNITETSVSDIEEQARGKELEDKVLSDAIFVDGNKLMFYDKEKERMTRLTTIDFDFYPKMISKTEPVLVGKEPNDVFLYDMRTKVKYIFYSCENTELVGGCWSKDNKYLAFNIHYKKLDEYVVFVYDRENGSISAVSIGKATGYVWSKGSNILLVTTKDYKKSTKKFEFKLDKCILGESTKTIYKVEGERGTLYPLNYYSNEVDDKGYVLIKVYDENDINTIFIYDFENDLLQSELLFREAYNKYMDRYLVDDDIKNMYSQLGNWSFPIIIESISTDALYISDGIKFFCYPHRLINGEMEIGNYDDIVTIDYGDEIR